MTAHYKPCVSCVKAQRSFYSDMFLCAAKGINVPNDQDMNGCLLYEPRYK
jgi:hypothetical protein